MAAISSAARQGAARWSHRAATRLTSFGRQNMRSLALRPRAADPNSAGYRDRLGCVPRLALPVRWSAGRKQPLRRRFAFGGLSGAAPPEALDRPGTERSSSLFAGPTQAVRAARGQADGSRWTMPLITPRSSSRGLPRLSAGSSGAGRRIRAALRRKRSPVPGCLPRSQGKRPRSHRRALPEQLHGS